MTSYQGAWGHLENAVGSSFAAPQVAGMAADLKDMYLQQDETWINNPGRLHTAMLAMGDRHRSSSASVATQQWSDGADQNWGLGRVKMRMFASGGGVGPWGARTGVRNLTRTTPVEHKMLWTTPMPTGTKVVKCVLFQRETMSYGKIVVSDVNIRLKTRLPNTSGQCVAETGTVYQQEYDASQDVKSKVAIEPNDYYNLDGKCAQLNIEAHDVSSTFGVTAFYYCYYAGIADDEPH